MVRITGLLRADAGLLPGLRRGRSAGDGSAALPNLGGGGSLKSRVLKRGMRGCGNKAIEDDSRIQSPQQCYKSSSSDTMSSSSPSSSPSSSIDSPPASPALEAATPALPAGLSSPSNSFFGLCAAFLRAVRRCLSLISASSSAVGITLAGSLSCSMAFSSVRISLHHAHWPLAFEHGSHIVW